MHAISWTVANGAVSLAPGPGVTVQPANVCGDSVYERCSSSHAPPIGRVSHRQIGVGPFSGRRR
jgi:hypothetical protein